MGNRVSCDCEVCAECRRKLEYVEPIPDIIMRGGRHFWHEDEQWIAKLKRYDQDHSEQFKISEDDLEQGLSGLLPQERKKLCFNLSSSVVGLIAKNGLVKSGPEIDRFISCLNEQAGKNVRPPPK